jgi:hypothetical protein
MPLRPSRCAAVALLILAGACGGTAGSTATAPTTASGSTSLPPGSPATASPGTTTAASSTTTTSLLATAAPSTLPATTASAPPSTFPPSTAATVPRSVATAPPPTTVAHADDFSFDECGKDNAADPMAVQNSVGVPGAPVALIADSIGSQVRFGLIAGHQHHWVVWSRCGASVPETIDAQAAGAVARFHPTVVVVALGTNDAGYPNPTPGAAAGFAEQANRLLDQIGPGPCVVWVDVAQVGDQALQTEMNTVNAGINAMFLRGVRVAKWTSVVATDPGVLVDRVHLSHHGVERRIQLLDAAVDSCVKKK